MLSNSRMSRSSSIIRALAVLIGAEDGSRAGDFHMAGVAGQNRAARVRGIGPEGKPILVLRFARGLPWPLEFSPFQARWEVTGAADGAQEIGNPPPCTGSVMRKQLPPPATGTNSSVAWFASHIWRARYRPRPVPNSWVVKNGSKICAATL